MTVTAVLSMVWRWVSCKNAKRKKLLAGRWGADPVLRRLEVMAAWAAAMGMSKWCGGVENEANRGKEEAKNSDLDCGADSMLIGLE